MEKQRTIEHLEYWKDYTRADFRIKKNLTTFIFSGSTEIMGFILVPHFIHPPHTLSIVLTSLIVPSLPHYHVTIIPLPYFSFSLSCHGSNPLCTLSTLMLYIYNARLFFSFLFILLSCISKVNLSFTKVIYVHN